MNERERALDHKCPNCGSKLEFKPELVNGYLCQNIYEYLGYLKSSEREKDKLKIPIVEEYIKNLENSSITKNH